MEIRKLFKNGKSVKIYLPKPMVKHLELEPGDYMQVRLNDTWIELRPFKVNDAERIKRTYHKTHSVEVR